MASLLRSRPQAISQCSRGFSTSAPRSVSLQWDKNDAEALADSLPPYPHGPTRWYKQSRHGLYGGQRMQVGNNVGETFGVKTRRTWHPNVFTKKLFSKSLNRRIQIRVTTRTLRTIDKVGGLDEYLLGEKEGRIKQLGESGWWLRWAIMQTDAVKARFAAERSRLGLPEPEMVESTVEEATDAEVAAATEQGEEVVMDDNFQMEVTPDLPPLKFRVGPGQHLVLTSLGWIRTRPFVDRQETQWKETKLREWQNLELPKQLERIEKRVRQEGNTRLSAIRSQRTEEILTKEAEGEVELDAYKGLVAAQKLSDEEVRVIMKAVRQKLSRARKDELNEQYERTRVAKELAKSERAARKASERAKEREAKKAELN